MSLLNKIFSSGPFSAVRPYLTTPQGEERTADPAPEVPSDNFERSETPEESSPPSAGDLSDGANRSGEQVSLKAFPQVVHLLVDPKDSWGEDLGKEVGLPVISLEEGSVETLEAELQKTKYAEGFILEGFPADANSAEKLDSLLENVSQEDHRVLSWELTHGSHQSVIDHYMDRDLLWMVPDSPDSSGAAEAQEQVLSCLQGLPALQ